MNKLSYLSGGVNPVWEAEDNAELARLLNKKFKPFLESEEFHVETGSNKDQIQIKVTLAKADQSMVYPLEAVFLRDPAVKASTAEVAAIMLDYLDVYWNEYLAGERDVLLPIDWSKHACDGVDFYLRGFIRNQSLESQADALFREHGFGGYDIEPISNET